MLEWEEMMMSRLKIRLALLVVGLVLVVITVGGLGASTGGSSVDAASSDTYTVNVTSDGAACTLSSCSLRGAILKAQNRLGADTIAFDIPMSDPNYSAGTGRWTLTLTGPLPVLGGGDPLRIDATTLVSDTCQSPFVIDAGGVSHALEITGTRKVLRGLVLTNAQIHGLYIHGAKATLNTLTCSQVISNTDDGVRISEGASRNQIGLVGESIPNLVGLNGGDGIEIAASSSLNEVAGNAIGINLAGTSAVGNADYGVRIHGGAVTNTVGAVSSSHSNLISGNPRGGILIAGPNTIGNVVQNNWLGPDGTGTGSLGFQEYGVVIMAARGNTVGAANLISGHLKDGVHIEGTQAAGNVVRGNHIGTTATGDDRLTNRRVGVMIQDGAHHNRIGSAIESNVISGNGYTGEYGVFGGVGILNASDNTLCNNMIGMSGSGTYTVPNAGSGVWLSGTSKDNDIGIKTQIDCENVIAWNEGCGVCVEGDNCVQNTVGLSSIHDNLWLGIDTYDGGNLELAPPVVTSYQVTGSQVDLEAEACPGCAIHVYSDDEGEGEFHEGTGTADPADGHFTWTGTPTAKAYTLLVVDAAGNTSEFSASPAELTLSIDDALPDVVVNKIAGDAETPADETLVEVVAEVLSWDPSLTEGIDVRVTVPGDLFGPPTRVFVRDSIGSLNGTSVISNDVGGGSYQVDAVDLLQRIDGVYGRRVVFRFEIPHGTALQQLTLEGEIEVEDRVIRDPEDTADMQIVGAGGVRGLIITNRTLLYQNHTDTDVTALLNQLYTEAQGAPASESPLAAVYYVDAYSTQSKNWDNTSIDYTESETAINSVARAIDGLIEDWHDDATEYMEVLHYDLPIDWPPYLLLVGDDDVIPFYRFMDPKDDEGVDLNDCDGDDVDEHPGWCTDSATNPAILATDENYFFTDNPFGDRFGHDWFDGDVELAVGRILGETAEDMLNLLLAGVDTSNGQRGGAVMASVSGWELGLVPHDPSQGDEPDIADVPALFQAKGFEVRNDDDPSTEVCTIDVMEPYESGWNTAFKDAANDAGGMDLFFIGGHNGYGHASIPGDNFTPDDTCSSGCEYDRFDDDHPVTLIVGCHGGLPVPDVDVSGGVDGSMVYDVIHEGGRAYIGATGYSYGSMEDLHNAVCGEVFMQGFFDELLSPSGSDSQTVGAALALAKRNFTFGVSSDEASRKTVTEFQLYGVPWSFLTYPGVTRTGLAPVEAHPTSAAGRADRPATQVQRSPVAALEAQGAYTQSFDVEVNTYEAVTRTVAGTAYHLFTVPGGRQAMVDTKPVLPYVKAFTLTLPISATVTGITVTSQISEALGIFNVPNALMRPWIHGGTTFTTTTSVSGLYPPQLVHRQPAGDQRLFTFYPIQHDPDTGETVVHRRVRVQVAYETPSDVVVSGVTLDRELYHPGDTMAVNASVMNLTDASLSLTATLTVRSASGTVIAAVEEPVSLDPGARHPYYAEVPAPLQSGGYRIVWVVRDEEGPAGGGARGFRVIDGRIAPFALPPWIRVGEVVTLTVGYQNYRPKAVDAQVRVLLHDDRGIPLGALKPQTITVPAHDAGVASFLWRVRRTPAQEIVATAHVMVGDRHYGPARRVSHVMRSVYLPVIMRHAP